MTITSLWSQDNYDEIDKEASYPHKGIKNIPLLANELIKKCSTDKEKARAIFIWITYNLDYDVQQSITNQEVETTDLIANRALRNRKGVCMHFAMLYDTLAKAAQLKTHYITGYAKESNGQLAQSAHAWIGINIDDVYYIIDPTWASGYVMNGRYINQLENKYFLMSPSSAILSHMPYDPIYQFLPYPITHRQFIHQEFNSIDSSSIFDYRDSLMVYSQLDRMGQLNSSLNRMEKIAFPHPKLDYQIDFIKDDISYEKYNQAQDLANLAIDQINQIITTYNNRIKGRKPDMEKIKNLLSVAQKYIEASDAMLSSIISDNETVLKLTLKQREQIGNLRNNLIEKQRYYETGLK